MKKYVFIFFLFTGILNVSGQAGRTQVLEDLEEENSNLQQNTSTATTTKSTRLFGAKDDLTTVIVVIPSGSVVNVLGSDSTYLHVTYEEDEGYIFRKHAVIDKKPKATQSSEFNQSSQSSQSSQFSPKQASREAQNTQQGRDNQQNRGTQGNPDSYNRGNVPNQQYQQSQQDQYSQNQDSRFSYLENKYGTSMASKLITGKIWKGMNTEMVKDSWGKAQKINRVINGNTIREEWIYKNSWLYFEDDELVEWGPAKR